MYYVLFQINSMHQIVVMGIETDWSETTSEQSGAIVLLIILINNKWRLQNYKSFTKSIFRVPYLKRKKINLYRIVKFRPSVKIINREIP